MIFLALSLRDFAGPRSKKPLDSILRYPKYIYGGLLLLHPV